MNDNLNRAIRKFQDASPVRVMQDALTAFLDATHDSGSVAHRLRLLAIELENAVAGWHDLRTIYEAAARADADDSLVLHSWGIAAIHWAESWRTPDLHDRLAITDEAKHVLTRALARAPHNSGIAYSLGLMHYNHPLEQHRGQAIDWFQRAVEWDASNVMAQLHIAHCEHDNKDWRRAIAAYEKVDLTRLRQEWRAVKCREQLAFCYARAGEVATAIRLFSALLDEIESWSDAELAERVVDVDNLVEASLDDPELYRRTFALVRRLRLEKRYANERCP